MKLKVLTLLIMSATVAGCQISAGTVDSSQRMLNQLGYNAGAVDGAYGGKTRGALEKFYADNGSSYDGKLDANEVADLTAAMDAAGFKVTRSGVGANMPGAGTVEVAKVPFASGRLYDDKYRIGKKTQKLPIPVKGTSGEFDGGHFRAQGRFWLLNFYRMGDFNRDGIQDYWLSGAFEPKNFRQNMSGTGEAYCVRTENGTCESKKTPDVVLIAGKNGRINSWDNSKDNYTDTLINNDLGFNQLQGGVPLVADFNGDGWDDVYTAMQIRSGGNGSDNGDGGFHQYYLSQPGGGLKESSSTHIRGAKYNKKRQRIEEFSHQADAGDLDNDGDIDIVLTSWDWVGSNGELICLWNDGTGKMTSKRCSDQSAGIVRHGDFNGDGHIDLIAGSGTTECLDWHGDNHWRNGRQKAENFYVMFGNGSSQWKHNRSNKITHLGYHQGIIDNVKVPLCGMPSMTVMDVDNDGDQDIVGSVIGYKYAGGYLQVLLNDGVGNFSLGQQIVHQNVNPTWNSRTAWADSEIGHQHNGWCTSINMLDLNRDGYMDFQCDGMFFNVRDGSIFVNKGDGTFFEADRSYISKYARIF